MMKLSNTLRVYLLGALLLSGSCLAMTVELGSGGGDIISIGSAWRFLPGTEVPSIPEDAWITPDFNDADWAIGPSGFGYGDNDDATILADMRNHYVTVYLRKTFSAAAWPPDALVELVIDYDDGFVAYLNGQEVARQRIANGPVTFETTASSHEAGNPETYVLGTVTEILSDGTNVLAIEGHNISKSSSDFSLIPSLRIASDTVKNGAAWIVETQTVTLRGLTEAPGVITVAIDDLNVDFDPDDGAWTGEVFLSPGWNLFTAKALNADGALGDYGQIQIIYVPPSNHVSGILTEDVTWSGTLILDSTVTVPATHVLTIEAGTVVLIKEDAGIVVRGQLLANGTQDDPIHMTHYGEGTTWDRMMFVQAEDSRLTHCMIEYADCEGDHK
ncbi:MAG: hypothetical protein HQ515_07455, partial [Phycisphaeraceae bacterium]|nr:hypothetical protein [Phycisphaeraceae bacterium]